jgi:CRP-like cAMP-binding protein
MTHRKTDVRAGGEEPSSNELLQRLPKDVQSRLLPELRSVTLEVGQTLYELRDEVDYVYFPNRGSMISLLSGNEDGSTVEVGVTGSEGFAGVSALLGNHKSSHRILVQLGDSATRIRSSTLRREFNQSEPTRHLLLGYIYTLMAQVSQTALCNRVHTVEERLSRWILVTSDRAVDGQQLPLTHEFLARMLGVNRSTLSLAASLFQQAGFISYRRGKIKVVDRKGLEGVTCSCYPIVKEYLREFSKD